MAIEFNCPHCQHQYRLKDELAGKTATCKGCRRKITIPQPITIPPDAPAMDAAAAEAAALAALADEPVQAEQAAASKLIDVECQHCNHKWTEPLERAGTKTVCPECKQLIKIPVPENKDYDWRQTKVKGPEGAKQNLPQKPPDAMDAGEAKPVSEETIKKHIIDPEEGLEPRPLKQKVMFVLVPLVALLGLGYGVRSCIVTQGEKREDRSMQEAQEEFAKSTEGLAKDEVGVYTALMHMAAGEHALRHDETKKFKEGMDQFAKAREALRPPPHTPARNAAVAELAVAALALGGTEEQAREQIRLRWMPDANLKLRPNERVFTVFEELSKTLDLVQPADPEFRALLARRLTRELVKRGQTAMASELLPRALFNQAEQSEGRALVALEISRADKSSDFPQRVAKELAGRGAELSKGGIPASAQTLFLALKPEKGPAVPPFSAASDASRYAYTGFHLLEGREPEALKVAQGTGRPEAQVRALTLYADWAADPGPALDSALAIISSNAAKKEVPISPFAVLRLAQIAAEKGKHDQAKQLADKLTDDGLKAWARGDTVRLRLASAPKEKGDEAWAELPDDPKKYRAGFAWGRLWLARHNTRLSGDRAAEVKTVSGWPAPFSAFGKAGVALGLQDREK